MQRGRTPRLAQTPSSTPRLVLYGTLGCHLCEQAALLLGEHLGGEFHAGWLCEVDIADDEALLARYALRIPVLRDALSGRELDWPFPPAQLQGLLAASRGADGTDPMRGAPAQSARTQNGCTGSAPSGGVA